MNRRQWLGYVAATVPLLCLSVPVVGATPAQEGHPHDALLHRLGCADAKQQQVRFVSVQHRKLVDADFEQPAPFYDRVLTFWEDTCGSVWVIMDYTGKDEKLREHFKRCFTSETFVFAVFERRDNPSFNLTIPPPHPLISYPAWAPTPEHPHAAWMRQNLGVEDAVLVSLDERPLRLAGMPASALTTTVWRDRRNGDKDHLIVQVDDHYSAGYFDMTGWR